VRPPHHALAVPHLYSYTICNYVVTIPFFATLSIGLGAHKNVLPFMKEKKNIISPSFVTGD
jgi:hypothetical protein